MAGCGSCGLSVPIVGNQVGRGDKCPHCEVELRACRHCRHYDATFARQCKEPFAEVPSDKDGANFCEFFQIGEGQKMNPEHRANLLSAAEALFKKH